MRVARFTVLVSSLQYFASGLFRKFLPLRSKSFTWEMAQADLVKCCRSAADLDDEKVQNSPLTKSSSESC